MLVLIRRMLATEDRAVFTIIAGDYNSHFEIDCFIQLKQLENQTGITFRDLAKSRRRSGLVVLKNRWKNEKLHSYLCDVVTADDQTMTMNNGRPSRGGLYIPGGDIVKDYLREYWPAAVAFVCTMIGIYADNAIGSALGAALTMYFLMSEYEEDE